MDLSTILMFFYFAGFCYLYYFGMVMVLELTTRNMIINTACNLIFLFFGLVLAGVLS